MTVRNRFMVEIAPGLRMRNLDATMLESEDSLGLHESIVYMNVYERA